MKKLAYFLAISLIISGCNSSMSSKQDKPSDSIPATKVDSNSSIGGAKISGGCIYCDENADHATTAKDAGILIRRFQNTQKFLKVKCGGTYFFDTKEIKSLKDMFNYPIERFHYCSVESIDVTAIQSPSMQIYLAFQKGECSGGSPDQTTTGVLNTNIIVADPDNYLPRFANNVLLPTISDDNFAITLQNFRRSNQHIPFSTIIQSKNVNDVTTAKSNLKSSKLFFNYIRCPEFEGNFKMSNSLNEILWDPSAKVIGFRYYFGLSDADPFTNSIRVILVGVGENGQNLTKWRETSMPHD